MDFAFDEPAARYDPPAGAGDRLDWLRLIRSRRVGPQTFHRLMAEHGTAAAALEALPGIAAASGLTGYEACPEGVARAEAAAARAAGARMLADCHTVPNGIAQFGVWDLRHHPRDLVAIIAGQQRPDTMHRLSQRSERLPRRLETMAADGVLHSAVNETRGIREPALVGDHANRQRAVAIEMFDLRSTQSQRGCQHGIEPRCAEMNARRCGDEHARRATIARR